MEKLNQKLTVDQAMAFAIELAEKGLGYVEPNPAVGCVILDSDDKLIGFGFHEKFGGPHAEINALKSVVEKETIKGAKVIVTLEPCGHTGKTPPCKNALIDAGVGTVIYGVSDPNPLFDNSGFDEMRGNSIVIEKYNPPIDVEGKLSSLVEKFVYSMENKKSFVSIKMGSSLDGQIALQNKESKWITGDKSRQHSHYLRATHEATLIGVGTLLDDNPSLNIRLDQFTNKKNKVIILDPNFRSKSFIKTSKLLKSIGSENIYIASVSGDEVKSSTFNHIEIEFTESGKINLIALVDTLKKMNINSILVEGGAETISEFLNQKVFNKIYTFLSPSIIGSGFGVSWTKGLVCEKLENKILLSAPEIQRFGDDILLSYRPKN